MIYYKENRRTRGVWVTAMEKCVDTLQNLGFMSIEAYAREESRITEHLKLELLRTMRSFPYGYQVRGDNTFEVKPLATPFDNLVSGEYYEDSINSWRIVTPRLLPGGNTILKESGKLFVFPFDGPSEWKRIEPKFNNLVLSVLSSVHPEDINVLILNPVASGVARLFSNSLKGKSCEKCYDDSSFAKALDALNEEIRDRISRYGDMLEYVIQRDCRPPRPFRIAIVIDDGHYFDNRVESLELLFKRGHTAGFIPFIVTASDNKLIEYLYDNYECFGFSDKLPVFDRTNRLPLTDWTPKYTLEQIGHFIDDKDNRGDLVSFKSPVDDLDILESFFNTYNGFYEAPDEDDTVVVGEFSCVGKNASLRCDIGVDGNETVQFVLDITNHPHVFVLGASGSGKSVLLHNMILGLVEKYSPEDLELYLLDFKTGGVEFNRYRNLPHIGALLVDNSDTQITLEIMRKISATMVERGKIFQEAEVQHVADYNKKFPESRMSQIVIFIDECHQLFEDNPEQREVLKVIGRIMKEGRSQGIHAVFATQTLSGADIPRELLNNISDFYLLRCASSDAQQLIKGSRADLTDGFGPGKVYYQHAQNKTIFQGNYTSFETAKTKVESIVERCKGGKRNAGFYFSGAQHYGLDEDIVALLGITGFEQAVGRSISVDNTPLLINRKKDYAENIILMGLNDDGSRNVTVTMLNLLASQIICNAKSKSGRKIKVINTYHDDDKLTAWLSDARDRGWIELSGAESVGDVLYSLADSIANHTCEPTDLFIFDEEKIHALRTDMKINLPVSANDEISSGDIMNLGINLFDKLPTSSSSDLSTCCKAFHHILSEGPRMGISTIIQLDKPQNLFSGEDIFAPKEISNCFNHLIIMRSDARVAMELGLDTLHPERFSEDSSRQRAYYYNRNRNSATLLTPFELQDIEYVAEVVNSIN